LRSVVIAVAAARCCSLSFGSLISTLRTYCMVSVEAPCRVVPSRLFTVNARISPRRSTPLCW
jgi:hypothetical protein